MIELPLNKGHKFKYRCLKFKLLSIKLFKFPRKLYNVLNVIFFRLLKLIFVKLPLNKQLVNVISSRLSKFSIVLTFPVNVVSDKLMFFNFFGKLVLVKSLPNCDIDASNLFKFGN